MSGDELSTLVLAPELQPSFFHACMMKYEKLTGEPMKGSDDRMGYGCFKDVVVPEIGGKFDMSLTTTADEVFHKWSDKGEDNVRS